MSTWPRPTRFQLGQGRGHIRQMLKDLAAYYQIERGWVDRETIDVRLVQLDPGRALPPCIGDGAGVEIAASQTPKRPLFGEILEHKPLAAADLQHADRRGGVGQRQQPGIEARQARKIGLGCACLTRLAEV